MRIYVKMTLVMSCQKAVVLYLYTFMHGCPLLILRSATEYYKFQNDFAAINCARNNEGENRVAGSLIWKESESKLFTVHCSQKLLGRRKNNYLPRYIALMWNYQPFSTDVIPLRVCEHFNKLLSLLFFKENQCMIYYSSRKTSNFEAFNRYPKAWFS